MAAVSAQSRSKSKTPIPARKVTVTTTARLHFGFLDPSGRGQAAVRLVRALARSAERRASRSTRADGFERDRARARARLERLSPRHRGKLRASEAPTAQIEEAIPPHAGLGSGTQLALAVGSAFAAFEDLRLDAQEIASRLGRGARSGIGIATFSPRRRRAGRRTRARASLPQLVSRLPFPAGMARAADFR